MNSLKVTVYCSSSNHIDPSYLSLGDQLGEALARASFTLVYGGGQQGIMGRLAKATTHAGGDVIGVISNSLIEVEKPYTQATELIYVDSLRERKMLLEDYADAFVVLPGGFGTFDEMFEVLTLKAIQIIQKPVFILNDQNFYTPLLDYLATLSKKGFMHEEPIAHFQVYNSVKEVMGALAQSLKK